MQGGGDAFLRRASRKGNRPGPENHRSDGAPRLDHRQGLAVSLSSRANPRMSQQNWEEVERVMSAYLELPEAQRAAYLAGQPAAVRAEVESLLEAYRGAGNFLGSETGKPGGAAEL